ncbi:MAG: hypothetical protein E6G39_20490 [Actinobacteria bacterium]|nr:MAG: hypothetical protein E6G39_20490 [Actinomycetota bacterium]
MHSPSLPILERMTVRGLTRLVRRPSLLIPATVMPVFFVVAFSGTFNGLTRLEGFGTDRMVNWMAPYAAIQGCSFAGVGAAGATAADLENGFFDRLLLAPCRRINLMLGPLLYSLARAVLPTTLVLLVALLLHARLQDPAMGLVMLYVGCLGIAIVYGVLGLALVYKLRTQRAMAIAQTLVFSSSFLSIGQVPLAFQTGWLHTVSRVNPLTNVLRMTRQGFLEPGVTWHETWPGLVALVAMIAVLGTLAARGLRKLGP